MKAYRLPILILSLLPLVLTLIALPLLPEEIPMHYGFDGEVTRWGSKFETLIFPALTLAFSLILHGVCRLVARLEPDGESNVRACRLMTLITLILFLAMTLFFLALGFSQATSLSALPVELNQVICVALGAGLIILGNIMPRVRRNHLLGFRTASSMKNDDVWKRSQLFAGASLMLCGGVTLIAGLLTRGAACMIVFLTSLLLATAASTVYAAVIAKKA